MSHDVIVCRQETGMRCTPNVHTITEIRRRINDGHTLA